MTPEWVGLTAIFAISTVLVMVLGVVGLLLLDSLVKPRYCASCSEKINEK